MQKQSLNLEEIRNKLYAMSMLLEGVSRILCDDNDKLWFGVTHVSNVLFDEAKRIEAWCENQQIHFIKTR